MNSSTFDLSVLKDETRRLGTWVRFWKGRRCTCNTAGDPNRAILTCQVCKGFGVVYPDQPIMVQGLLHSASNQYMLREIGVIMPGDMSFSVDPSNRWPRFQDRDLIRLDPKQLPSGETHALQGDIIRRGFTDTDQLQYEVAKLDQVLQDDPVTGATTAYATPGDFTISGRNITWVTGHGPEAGTTYGVYYSAFHPYMVFVPPSLNQERGQRLGQHVLLRRIDVVLALQQQTQAL